MFEDLVYSLTCSSLADVSLGIHAEGLVARSKLYGHLAAGTPLALIAPDHSDLRKGISQQVGEAFSNGGSSALSTYILRLREPLGEHQQIAMNARRNTEAQYSGKAICVIRKKMLLVQK